MHIAVTIACVCTYVSRVRCHFKAALVIAFLFPNSVKRWSDASGNIRHVAARTDVNIPWPKWSLRMACSVSNPSVYGRRIILLSGRVKCTCLTVICTRTVCVMEKKAWENLNEFICVWTVRLHDLLARLAWTRIPKFRCVCCIVSDDEGCERKRSLLNWK